MPDTSSPTRRAFLRAGIALPATLAVARAAQARDTDTYTYQITRTEEEWRARLSDEEYQVLRKGGTEVPHTSLNAFREDAGSYACKGCDLEVFTSTWKVVHADIGWAFFTQAQPMSILTSIDSAADDMVDAMGAPPEATIECHCRRCGSHLGHILTVKGQTLHCINGSALTFYPQKA